MAARATAGPPVTQIKADAAVIEDGLGRFQRRLGDHANQVVDAQIAVDRLVEAAHALGGDSLAAGMRIDDQRVAAGDHADGVAGDRRQRVRDRRDGADDAERGVLDDRQAVIAAEDLAPMNSTPGERSPSVLSFSILCSSRPILVSSISIVPSSTHCSIEMRRMWSMMPLAVFDRRARRAARTPRWRRPRPRRHQVNMPKRPLIAAVAD